MLDANSLRKHKLAAAEHADKVENELANNLRYLCDQKSSISKVCRDLDINRQQFNKYLSGISKPSNSNLIKICDYFKCDSSSINLPHQQFIELSKQAPNQSISSDSQHLLDLLEVTYPKADKDLDRYLGFYNVYCHSMGFPGYIAKSVAHFYLKEGRMFCKTIEKMDKVDEEKGPCFTFKYFGLVSLISDRIYIMEIESLLKKNLSMSILYPTYQPKFYYLNGINAGVSSTHGRDPACRYITYEFLGTDINIREAFRGRGLFRLDSDKISDDVKNRLKVKRSEVDPDVFFGYDYI